MAILAPVMKRIYLLILVFVFQNVVSYSQDYNNLVEKSFECINNEDWACAEESMIKALELEPANAQNALLLSNLGTVQRYMGKTDKALKSYTNALMIMPRSVTLLKNRASLYASIDSLDKAITDYSTAISLDGDEEDILYERGIIYLQKRDTLSARYDFEHILKTNPNSRSAYMGFATLMKYRNYYSEAVDLYTKVLKQNDKDAEAYFGRAEAYFYIGKMLKAREDLKKAMEIDANDPLFYVLRAKIEWSQFEKERAMADFDKAVTLGASKEKVDEIIADLQGESKKRAKR